MMWLAAGLSAAALAACFDTPEPVTIRGYAGHAMEPFIARDGSALFFNSRNGPQDQTDIFWATPVDETTFAFRGAVEGANSAALDGVPSLSRDGAFAMISPRALEARHATIWTGAWRNGSVTSLRLETALSPGRPPHFNMDAEISADGAHLYFTDNIWAPVMPRTSDLRLAVLDGNGWRRAPEADRLFARINTAALEYAPATSADELELYFTRLTRSFLRPPRLEIMVAARGSRTEPYGAASRIAAISGFVEGPTVAPDGAIYFHAKIDEHHRIMRARRTCVLGQ
jgi:hypothetical protein